MTTPVVSVRCGAIGKTSSQESRPGPVFRAHTHLRLIKPEAEGHREGEAQTGNNRSENEHPKNFKKKPPSGNVFEGDLRPLKI